MASEYFELFRWVVLLSLLCVCFGCCSTAEYLRKYNLLRQGKIYWLYGFVAPGSSSCLGRLSYDFCLHSLAVGFGMVNWTFITIHGFHCSPGRRWGQWQKERLFEFSVLEPIQNNYSITFWSKQNTGSLQNVALWKSHSFLVGGASSIFCWHLIWRGFKEHTKYSLFEKMSIRIWRNALKI